MRRLIRLDKNESPYPPSPRVLRALADEVERGELNRYPAEELQREAEEAVAEYCGLSTDMVHISCGSEGAVCALIDALARAGDVAVVVRPSYAPLARFARARGLRVREVLLKRDFTLNVEELAEAARGARLLFLVNPNNPTGNLVASVSDVEELARRSRGLYVVVDEAYYEFSGVTSVRLVGELPNVVVVRTFSKAFGLAGMRVGYVAAPADVVRALREVEGDMPVSTLAYRAVVEALSDLDYVREVVRRVSRERDRLLDGLRSIRGIRAHPSLTNFVLFECSIEGLRERLAAHGVMIRDFTREFRAAGFSEGCFYRVSVGLPDENDAFVEALRAEVERASPLSMR